MNHFAKYALLLVNLSALQAEGNWQWGVTAGLGGLAGAEPAGAKPLMSLLGVQARWTPGNGHMLQAAISSRMAKGESTQIFTLHDGAPYQAETRASTGLNWDGVGVEYHRYLGGQMGRGWHPYVGVGFARISQWKSLSSRFDMPEKQETEASKPFATLGVGCDLSRRWSLSLGVTGTQVPLLGTQVDPRHPTLVAEKTTLIHTVFSVACWF